MLDLFQSYTNSHKFDFKITKVLSSNRFPIILVEHASDYLVLKLFPLFQGQLTHSFLQESSALGLEHPHILKLHHSFTKYPWGDNGNSISAVLMEHALQGDLLKLLKSANSGLSEEAVRTLFHQLLSGLEYLHDQGLAHLDLKPDNLFLDENFILKIGDFDQVTPILNGFTYSHGTANYRAPEIKQQNCLNLPAADVFSAGVILFVMKSRVPPFIEGKLFKNANLYDELSKGNKENFWEVHTKVQNTEGFYGEAFRNLIENMLHPDPECRPSIEEIRKSEWFQGSVLELQDLRAELAGL